MSLTKEKKKERKEVILSRVIKNRKTTFADLV